MSYPVGFIGLGAMGLPMAIRLRDEGRDLIVWTRTRAHAQRLRAANVRIAAGPGEVARSAPVILSCLLNNAAISDVYLGGDGLIANAREGAALVEHGTFSPDFARLLGREATARRAHFVDAPVSGGTEGARQGTLVCMAGGEPDAVDQIRGDLSAYCSFVERVGRVGVGLSLKLVNQMLVAAHALAAAEAAMLVQALDIPHDVATRVLAAGWGSSTMLQRNLAPALSGQALLKGATIGHLYEVLELVRSAVARAGLPTIVEPIAHGHFAQAVSTGYGDLDIANLLKTLDIGAV